MPNQTDKVNKIMTEMAEKIQPQVNALIQNFVSDTPNAVVALIKLGFLVKASEAALEGLIEQQPQKFQKDFRTVLDSINCISMVVVTDNLRKEK